jgi:hypothetical protein
MLRALTTVSALNAHQLRPEIEPDGSVEDCMPGDFSISYGVLKAL